MDFFKKILKKKNKDNLTDYGLQINEKKEKELINKYESIFNKFINKRTLLNEINKNKKTKYIPEELKKELIYNFITLINENTKVKINLVKYSLNAAIEDDTYITYMISFYSNFDENHIRPFNIFIIIIFKKKTDDIKNLNIKNNIAYIKILGSKPTSDISFGTDYKLLKSKMINIFKDKPLKLIYNQSRINNYLNKKENITKDKYERGFPLKKFETINPVLIFPKNNIKIKIGEKCITDKNNKVFTTKCEEAKKYKYDGLNIKNEYDYCLSYHYNKNLSFIPCNINTKCEYKSDMNNCKNFKFRKYGSIEIDGLNKCLDENLSANNCLNTKKFKIY